MWRAHASDAAGDRPCASTSTTRSQCTEVRSRARRASRWGLSSGAPPTSWARTCAVVEPCVGWRTHVPPPSVCTPTDRPHPRRLRAPACPWTTLSTASCAGTRCTRRRGRGSSTAKTRAPTWQCRWTRGYTARWCAAPSRAHPFGALRGGRRWQGVGPLSPLVPLVARVTRGDCVQRVQSGDSGPGAGRGRYLLLRQRGPGDGRRSQGGCRPPPRKHRGASLGDAGSCPRWGRCHCLAHSCGTARTLARPWRRGCGRCGGQPARLCVCVWACGLYDDAGGPSSWAR